MISRASLRNEVTTRPGALSRRSGRTQAAHPRRPRQSLRSAEWSGGRAASQSPPWCGKSPRPAASSAIAQLLAPRRMAGNVTAVPSHLQRPPAVPTEVARRLRRARYHPAGSAFSQSLSGGEEFEPSVQGLPVQRFSRPATTRASAACLSHLGRWRGRTGQSPCGIDPACSAAARSAPPPAARIRGRVAAARPRAACS